jgi:ATP-dependent Clp protease ATP-binding subunit ClpA
MRDKDTNIRNELSLTFWSISEKIKDITNEIQNKIKTNKEKNFENNDYLANIEKTLEENARLAKGEIPLLETSVSSKFSNSITNEKYSDIPFINNHLKENPESIKKIIENKNNKELKETKYDPNILLPALVKPETVMKLEEEIKNKVFGQDQVISDIVQIFKVAALNFRINPVKPVGAYLFAGPSGVGKTELASTIASTLGVEFLKIDMGELSQEHEVNAKLIGAPAGYVGSEEEGLLVRTVKEHPNCVILLDEIEKAHHSIDKILLGILDKGVARTNKGEIVRFQETVIICTSNLGAEVEYFTHLTTEEKHKERMNYIKDSLRPELISRFDKIFQFNSLKPDIYKKIIQNKFLNQLTNMAKNKHNFDLKFSDKIVDWIVEKSYDPALGGRPAAKFIELIVLNPLVNYILINYSEFKNIVEYNKELLIDLNKNGQVCFKGKNKKILNVLENTEELLKEFNSTKFTEESEIKNKLQKPVETIPVKKNITKIKI